MWMITVLMSIDFLLWIVVLQKANQRLKGCLGRLGVSILDDSRYSLVDGWYNNRKDGFSDIGLV